MPEYKLDKIFNIGTIYRAETDKYYIIKTVGTNSTTKATVKVAGSVCGEFIDKLTPLQPINTNLWGPIPLNECFIVVPPGKTIEFTGESGKVLRLTGIIGELAPAEALPPPYMARYGEQPKKYLTYETASLSKAAGTTIPAGTEETILTRTCPPGEKHLYNNRYGGQCRANTTVYDGDQFATRIYVEGKPHDIFETTMGRKGIASKSAPLPPKEDVNTVGFTLADAPIELTPGRTLTITYINVGPDFTVPTGTTWYAETILAYIKELI